MFSVPGSQSNRVVLERIAAVRLPAIFQWPETAEAWDRFASVPIRHSGTLVGNVANGSPIGDSMPVLIALGAQVELMSAAGASDPLTAYNQGIILWNQGGKAAEAQAQFQKAIDLDPKMADAYYFVGMTLVNQGNAGIDSDGDPIRRGETQPEQKEDPNKLAALRARLQTAWKNLISPGGEQTEQRRVDPYHLANINGEWYLFAYDHLRKDIRTFVPARIKSIKQTGKTFGLENVAQNRKRGYENAADNEPDESLCHAHSLQINPALPRNLMATRTPPACRRRIPHPAIRAASCAAAG